MRTKIILLFVLIFMITPLVYSQTLTNGLKSFYKLDEASGSAMDSHGNNHGTAYGQITRNVPSLMNTAYDFDNIHVNNYIDLGNNFDFSNGFSISLWLNARQKDGLRSIFSQGTGIVCYTYNGRYFIMVNGTVIITTSTDIQIPYNWWGNFIIVWDKVTYKVYTDGRLRNTTNRGIAPNSPALPLIIGDNEVFNKFDGLVDEIGIWERALTQEEITQIHTLGYQPVGDSYPFGESEPSKPGVDVWMQRGSNIFYNEGNVGIGTDITPYPLSIKGPANAVLEFGNSNVGGTDYNFIQSFDRNAGTFAPLKFIAGGGPGGNERSALHITADGKVGIGTSTPLANLDVNGNINMLDGDLYKDGRKIKLDGGGLRWVANDTNLYYDMGNLGIGLIDPTKKLDVNGDINFTGDLYKNGELIGRWKNNDAIVYCLNNVGIGTNIANSKLEVLAGSSNTEIARFAGTVSARGLQLSSFLVGGTNEVGFDFNAPGAGGSAAISFSTLGVEAMRIIQGGNVGIGTISPENSEGWERVLDVYGNSHSKILASTSTVTAGMWSHGIGFYGSPAGGIFGTKTDHPVSFITNSSPKVVITSSGDVGIGTTSPTKKLDVNGDMNLTGDIYQNGQLFGVWRKNGADLYYLGGNIGIGENTPEVKLHVVGSGKFKDSWGSLNLDPDGISFTRNFPNAIWAETTSGSLIFGVGTGDKTIENSGIYIDQHNNVGMGTSFNIPSGYKLAVNGKIICEEVRVELSENWADFVFEPDYNLMSLKELETFIITNKHLPEIPTTAEVKENGISVGEMNAKLLQKIEELTLYMLEKDKEMRELKNEVEILKKLVKSE